MFNITFKKEKCKEENAKMWFLSVIQYVKKIKFFNFFNKFKGMRNKKRPCYSLSHLFQFFLMNLTFLSLLHIL